MPKKNSTRQPDLNERLRIENEVIKMKLMLEHGAQFSSGSRIGDMDPALEYAFLKHVLAMEEAHRTGRNITVFEKLGCPTDIPPAESLQEEEFTGAICSLQKRLAVHGIEVRPVDQEVDPADMYRFMTEDLMSIRIIDADAPTTHCIIFDEAQTSPGQGLERVATHDCLPSILAGRSPVQHILTGRPFLLNGIEHTEKTSIHQRLSGFRNRYEDIISLEIATARTLHEGNECEISGTHATALCQQDRCDIVRGEWSVTFQRNRQGEWHIANIEIEGLRV